MNCFAAFHYRGSITTCHKVLLDAVFNSDCKPSLGLPSKYAPTSMTHMKLPTEIACPVPIAFARTKVNNARNGEVQHQLKRHISALF
jgi:hypothetical protein